MNRYIVEQQYVIYDLKTDEIVGAFKTEDNAEKYAEVLEEEDKNE